MMTMMLLMLAGLPECAAFRAYDCNNQSSQIKQYSLLDPEPCGNMEKVHAIERIKNQEGTIGAGHQVYSDTDNQVGVMWLAEPHGPRAVREVSRSNRD
jgi:hypothetical protein